MRRTWLALSGCFLLVLLGCSLFNPSTGLPDTLPVDFNLHYDWQEGSLAPPFHYEYSITLESDGRGELVMIPDYPGEDVPVWVEGFQVDADAMNELYQLMLERGVFTTDWRAQGDPPVGGSFQWLTVSAGGQTVEIPAFPIESQAEAAEAVSAAINRMVPQATWDKLDAQRDEYVATHEN